MDDFHPFRIAIFSTLGLIGLIVIFSLFGAFYSIKETERGVLTTNGALTAIVEPGLHFKWPWFQGVTAISIQQQVARFDCTDATKPCVGDHAFVMQAYSKDQQPADLRVSVNWHVPSGFDAIRDTYVNYGDLFDLASRTVWRKSPQEVKTVFGQFDAVSVIQTRAEFNKMAFDVVAESMKGTPVVIDAVQLEDIQFSKGYEDAVEQRMLQQVAVQKQQQNLEQERILAEIKVVQAKGAADSLRATADANAYQTHVAADAVAYATQIQGEASASAIKSRALALAGNPLLIEQTKAERWNGVLPTTMLPDGAVPFLSVIK